ncbi:uncharacterized protein LOC113236855 [Hyposmocoma kahamanoa]|uniref:uncharacterized protein LOC113236855 n=1 Tax=Hyposmocoma kahamanoa TaxID=1477025 RepID=UPI000E6D5D48|nr:uncharacterized protein LOC113236855 [Hyposmocoma kahamanoa]
MQCFICVTYMFLMCGARLGAHPGAHPSDHHSATRENPTQTAQRSLFHDVIESLRIRSQLPDDNNENNLSQNYERYGYENEPQLPSDADFIPRRNDRIEMPTLKYRFPKSLSNDTEDAESSKEEIVVFIATTVEPKTTTEKPKKQKRPRPPVNKKPNKKDEDDQVLPEFYPSTNTMAGQSQIGNRESQLVVKPTVIVNLRGTVTHRESDIRIEGRTQNDTQTASEIPYNIFNINQRILLERTFGTMGNSVLKKADDERVKEGNSCDSKEASNENRKEKKIENIMEVWLDLPNINLRE